MFGRLMQLPKRLALTGLLEIPPGTLRLPPPFSAICLDCKNKVCFWRFHLPSLGMLFSFNVMTYYTANTYGHCSAMQAHLTSQKTPQHPNVAAWTLLRPIGGDHVGLHVNYPRWPGLAGEQTRPKMERIFTVHVYGMSDYLLNAASESWAMLLV